MKVLFTGLGSIGARHLKNLRNHCDEKNYSLDVTALRSSDRKLEPDLAALVNREIRYLEPDECFDMAFITGPTHLHETMLVLLQGKANSFFIEKPIFEKMGYDLETLGLGRGQKAYVAAPMRWCGLYQELKQILPEYQVFSARSICSSYLPDWRPGVDYTKVYSARQEMGGGVALDLIHEWDYLVDLFGMPQQYRAMQGRFSDLEINSDDLAVYIAQFKGFLAELHLDYFGRKRRRELELFTKQGNLLADFETGMLTLPDGEVCDYSEDVNRRYEREMEYFVEYAREGFGESLNSPARATEVLKIALGES